MTSPTDKMDAILAREPIVPVLTIEDVQHAVPLARALISGGIRALEITLRTKAAEDSVRAIRRDVPEAIVGLGTVTSSEHIALAKSLDAAFIVTPGTTQALHAAIAAAAIPCLPGVATASEIIAAQAHGHRLMKFFPAVPAGGLGALKAFAGPFPTIRFCPTGGIGEAEMPTWLGLPNVAAVGGSWLAPPALIAKGDWAGIRDIAARSVAAARSVRRPG
jgi:2-dehydro-3-deoxyphosphogluconate aldolase / (4S)-4-hydroxy-2-oxoglutarate aldolase